MNGCLVKGTEQLQRQIPSQANVFSFQESTAHVPNVIGTGTSDVSCPCFAGAFCSDLEHDLRVFEPDIVEHGGSAQHGSTQRFSRGATAASRPSCGTA